MSKEAIEEVVEEVTPETPEIDGDAESSAPEASEEATPTEQSDAESETALDAKALEEKLAKAEKKLAKEAYQNREARRKEERLMSMLEQSNRQEKTEPKAPKIEDFETLDEYVDARFEYLQKANEPEAAPQNHGDPAFNQKRDDLFFEGSSKYEDFVEKVASDDVPLTPAMVEAIFELEDMDTQVELAYNLAGNPREVMRIARLSPIRQAAEIGKLEAKLTAPTPAKKQPSTAPAPIKPVGGTKTSPSEIRDGMDPAEFIRIRNKQLGRG